MRRSPCICIFSSLYSPSVGGVETYTKNLAETLANENMRVLLVTCNIEGLAERSMENGVEIIRLPCRNLLHGRYPVPHRGAASQHLWRLLASQDIDFVLINTRFYILSLQALRFSAEKGVAPVVIEHGSAHLTLGNPILDLAVRSAEHALTSACRRYSAHYYGVSKKSSEWLRHFGINSSGELPNAIEADDFAQSASSRKFRDELGIPSSAFLVSFAGRLVPEKGILPLVEAGGMLMNENVHVAIAGDGPLLERLQSKRTANVHFVGRIDRQDISALLQQSDAFCLPSRSEGFATALLEAAACKTPVITTKIGGVDELLPDPSYGYTLPEISPETIARTIQRAQSRPDETRAKGAKMHELASSEFSWTSTAAKAVEACRKAQDAGINR